jgi:hypothetical protein
MGFLDLKFGTPKAPYRPARPPSGDDPDLCPLPSNPKGPVPVIGPFSCGRMRPIWGTDAHGAFPSDNDESRRSVALKTVPCAEHRLE